MPKSLFMFIALMVLVPVMSGCDSQASQQAEAQKYLDVALAKFQQANAGYITADRGTDAENLSAYRQKVLDSAFEDLQKVMALDAPIQKLQAQRVSAEINMSAARYAAREAAVESADLANRSMVLLNYLSSLESSQNRAASLEPKTQEQISKLQDEVQVQVSRQSQLNAEVDDIDNQLQAVTAEIKTYTDRADEGYAQAQAIREKAFITSGDKSYELLNQAAELERKAAIESATAEQQRVMANDLNAKLEHSRVQLDTVNKLITELNQQINEARANTARLTDASVVAREAGDKAIEALAEEYKQITDIHTQAVQQRMARAGEKIAQAVQALEKAASASGSTKEDKVSIQLKLLAAYIDQADIAANHAAYVNNLADVTRTILGSVQKIAPDKTELFQSQLDTLTSTRNALQDKAGKAIESGLALAEQLAPEGTTADAGEVQAIALEQKARLNAYRSRGELANDNS